MINKVVEGSPDAHSKKLWAPLQDFNPETTMQERLLETMDKCNSVLNTSKYQFDASQKAENQPDDQLSKKNLTYKQMIERMTNDFSDKPFIQINQMKQMRNLELEPNVHALTPALEMFKKMYNHSIELSEKLIDKTTENRRSKIKDVYIESAGLYFIDYCVWSSIHADKDHVFYKPMDHPDWKRILENYEEVLLSSEEQIFRNSMGMKKFLDTGVAATSRSLHYKNKASNLFMHTCYQAYYICAGDKRERQNAFERANPNIETAKQVWNYMEVNETRPFMLTILDGIEYSEILHLPKLQDPITLDNVHDLPKYEAKPDLPREYVMFVRGDENKHNPLTHTQVRINSATKLPVNLKNGKRSELPRGKENAFENLIIHTHGGGFISQSSFSHQLYTRKWANTIPNSVVFSIDYRLAPESKFPAAIDDIW